jgi:signal transduction histidine kinase/pSer/pThr/pTyr-binding forkhead associated (FHA) protein
MLRLMVIAGPDLGLTGEFDEVALTLGRGAGNQFQLTDPRISGRHGEITRVGGSFRYQDLGSRNGSQWVSPGRAPAPVEGVVPLADGDGVALGPGTLVVARTGVAASADAEVTLPGVAAIEERLQQGPVTLLTRFRFERCLADAMTVPEIWSAIRDGLAAAFPAATGITVLSGGEELPWQPAAALDRRRGAPGESAAPTEVAWCRMMVADATSKRTARLYRDSFQDLSVGPETPAWPIFATMCAPLIAGDEVIGAVQVDHRAVGAPFDTHDLDLFAALCHRAALAVAGERARSRRLETQRQQFALALDHDTGEWTVLVSSLTDDLAGSARRLVGAMDAAETGARARIAGERDYFWECLETLRANVTMARQVAFPLSHSLLERPWAGDREPVDLPVLLRQLARTERPRAAQEIEVTEISPMPPVLADRGRLFRALLNLLQNALEAQRDGGPGVSVALSAQVEPIADPRFPDGRCMAITVADTGPGIDPDVLARLNAGEAVTTREHGAGMGVKIARAIVTAHGGTLSLDSREGEGTTATVRLPLA